MQHCGKCALLACDERRVGFLCYELVLPNYLSSEPTLCPYISFKNPKQKPLPKQIKVFQLKQARTRHGPYAPKLSPALLVTKGSFSALGTGNQSSSFAGGGWVPVERQQQAACKHCLTSLPDLVRSFGSQGAVRPQHGFQMQVWKTDQRERNWLPTRPRVSLKAQVVAPPVPEAFLVLSLL